MALTTQSAPRSVLNGRFAECAIGGTVVGLCFEWTVKVTTPTADVTAHGDVWEFNAALPSRWEFTAKEYVPVATAAHIMNTLYTSSAVPVQITVAGYSGSVASGTKIFEGTGTPTGAELNAPMDMATQGFSVQGNGAPATGV